jgi:hypothetical protein
MTREERMMITKESKKIQHFVKVLGFGTSLAGVEHFQNDDGPSWSLQ